MVEADAVGKAVYSIFGWIGLLFNHLNKFNSPSIHVFRCDPNRNFPFQFGGEGTSSNPCSNTFKGPTALSETESKALANFMQKVQNNSNYETTAYISFHSYGQLWLLPWGYTSGAHPDDFDDNESLGHNVVSAIYGVDGTLYESGGGADILYGVGGASDDYAKAIGFNYSVTAEMRDTGSHGFLLPPDQIEINAQGTLTKSTVNFFKFTISDVYFSFL